MSKRPLYDVIVVGAGIMGSSAAYHLAKAGKETLLLDQFPLPHTRGSSHGQTRIIRKAYGQDVYIHMMLEAYSLWDKLEKESGEQLIRRQGLLYIEKENYSFEELMQKFHLDYEKLSAADLKRRFPMLRFPEDRVAILEKSGGVVMADKALKAFQSQAQVMGAVIQDEEEVLTVLPGNIITVTTSRGQYTSRSVVLTTGSWASSILKPLGIDVAFKPKKVTICYWKQKPGSDHSPQALPAFIDRLGVGEGTFGAPSMEYPGMVKLCCHAGFDIDPDERDTVDNSQAISELSSYVKDHFPMLETPPSIVESCIYTNLPGRRFILDVHPQWKNIVIGAGFSGHGFKLSPVVGRILSELSTNGTSSTDISYFKLCHAPSASHF